MSVSMAVKKRRHRTPLLVLHILQCLILRHHHQPRRPRLLLLPPLAALSASFLLFTILLFFIPPIANRPHPAFTNGLKIHMKYVHREDVFRIPISGGSQLGRDLWTSNQSSSFHGCSNASSDFLKKGLQTESNRYLLIATSGGLNQQRTGIIDAVAAAYIMNATLVVPKLDQKSFWKDNSNFSDIFDVHWFIASLSNDVKIIQQLPEKVRKFSTTRAPRKCDEKCYETRVLPIFAKKRVQAIQLKQFDYRLSNRLNVELQKLRCRANYHALRFTNPIQEMGRKLVERMRMKSKHFVALHLRFEPDMLAFTGCYYGGGAKEMEELGKIRKRWKTLHKKDPDRQRRGGKCPLSPEEVGLMLRALGYGSNVHIYVASGEVYGGEGTLAPLKALFPNLHTKETLASKEELEPFVPYSSQKAALDFIVCDESDVLVTNNNGNMAKMLAGKRRYFGHKPTIRPSLKKLQSVFLDRHDMTWEEFRSGVETAQVGFMGEPNEVIPGKGAFYEHPLSCICEKLESTRASPAGVGGTASIIQSRGRGGDTERPSVTQYNSTKQGLSEEDKRDLVETEYSEDEKVI